MNPLITKKLNFLQTKLNRNQITKNRAWEVPRLTFNKNVNEIEIYEKIYSEAN